MNTYFYFTYNLSRTLCQTNNVWKNQTPIDTAPIIQMALFALFAYIPVNLFCEDTSVQTTTRRSVIYSVIDMIYLYEPADIAIVAMSMSVIQCGNAQFMHIPLKFTH